MDKYTNLLTIAIPTYNRSLKLIRLIEILSNEIKLNNLYQVKIIVSDNGSTDDTEAKIQPFLKEEFEIKYYKQSENLGFDYNIKFLYDKCITDYIWFFSDDDYPFEGSVKRVLDGLFYKNPDVVLFSFMQPPGSTIKQFNFIDDLKQGEASSAIINSILAMPKLTIYVLKKTSFNEELIKIHNSSIGEGWMFIMLALSVLKMSLKPKLAVISDHLASSDNDFKHIWVPTPFLHMYKIAKHPYIKFFKPNLEEELKTFGYYQCIIFSWAIVTGVLTIDDYNGLNKFISDLEWRIILLIKRPKIFIKFIIMKVNLVPVFLKFKSRF